MDKSLSFRNVAIDLHPLAQEFYSSVDYFDRIQAVDKVYCACKGDGIIGVVRLAPENGVLVLRGMMMAPEFQRMGVGTQLLKVLEKDIGPQDSYCLPHDWLEGFYGQVGFVRVQDQEAPPHLLERLIHNRQKYPQLIAMKRTFSAN